MQQHSLLATKLYIPPIRPELVSRPRLIERLNAGLKRGGRSFFASSPSSPHPPALARPRWSANGRKLWTRQLPPSIAWLSLDEGDNDPARFLAYMIAALRTIGAPT